MSVKQCDEFGSDLFKSGLENGVTLDPFIAQNLIDEVEKGRGPSYQAVCDAALDMYLLEGVERQAFTDFLGRVFGRRRRERQRIRREAFSIPFAPR
ncbi:hypothetical protein A3F55_03195 [Candidatus Adlerbacteria bacterium RIFCSPHIGHO2_12_FULL_53_18]|uniref:Uncharacterized protein n=1 Tax=Candidatus Adlerbacteria bacterium RIFCSPHIGHO2_12_FULL_53_18 TaxID=1797242 RepID=A0A1F4XSH0_9BACT|nr:MAG: hypothetical protein A3F55_03195 [Candidatus Adlerbacteria bacterium RIFCSPHIGHO2_12_FULL_53_18]